ncbi:hypothetical protein G7Y89_g12311 [Cudoniella acicularis]|uniref:Profilin n=1 Tax=Cudoniella acicularis TaxID=354080 RepID=A0A8H4R934_9HELO|nr:hypothetical protein G7Y89_g12311 [Cudoniella acicularis]
MQTTIGVFVIGAYGPQTSHCSQVKAGSRVRSPPAIINIKHGFEDVSFMNVRGITIGVKFDNPTNARLARDSQVLRRERNGHITSSTTNTSTIRQPVDSSLVVLHRLRKPTSTCFCHSTCDPTFRMSWQAYVDSSLLGSGHLDKASIISVKGDSTWATSPGFTVAPPEIAEIVGGLSGNPAGLYEKGLHVAGERYVLTKAEDRSLYARKGREGIVIVKCTQCILIAHYKDGMIAGNAATTVEQLADYLIQQGY